MQETILSMFKKENSNNLFVYDDGSSITCLNNEALFLPNSIVFCTPLKVNNSSGEYTRINQMGQTSIFGNVFYDQLQFINILCAYDIERNEKIKVKEIKDKSGIRIGYDISIEEWNLTLYARWYGKIMVGSLEPILKYLNDKAETMLVSVGAKAKANLKTMAKTERAVNRVRRLQYRLGYQSDEHAHASISRGFVINIKDISTSDLRFAAAVGGPDIPMLKGKGTIDRSIEYYDRTAELQDGELLLEMDIGFLGQHAFLIGLTLPFNYALGVYLGPSTKGYKTAGALYNAICEINRIVKTYGFAIRFIYFDSERSMDRDQQPLDLPPIQSRMKDDLNIECIQLPTGVHCKRVERKIQHWKGKVRSCNFKLTYAIPNSWIKHLGLAAIIWCNMDPTDANMNMTPPICLMKGSSIDANISCLASFGEIVMAHRDNGVKHGDTKKSRRDECIYLYPQSWKDNKHKLLALDSIEGRHTYIDRTLKMADVLPITSLSIVARINVQAKKEKGKLVMSSDVEEDFNMHTGYKEDLLIDTPIDLLRRDSRTIGISGIPPRTQDSYTVKDSASTVYGNEEVVFLTTLIAKGEKKEETWLESSCFVVKKELPYARAMKTFEQSATQEAMRKEFTGLVSKWHPIKRNDMTYEDVKKVLPGHALVKMKGDALKGRFVTGGNRQDPTEYDIYREISTPTAMLSSFFGVVAHAAATGRAVASFDVKQAYTKAPMPANGRRIRVKISKDMVDIIMTISEEIRRLYSGYVNSDGSVYVELDYALYGCLEAGRLWYEYFKDILVSKMGYTVCPHDDCVFNNLDNNGIVLSTIVIHVDDGFVTASTEAELDIFFERLQENLGDLTITRGRVHEYLGMLLDFRHEGKCFITIKKLIDSLLDDFDIKKERATPARSNLFDIDDTSPSLSAEEQKKLHRGIAQLLYLASHVRPEVLCPTIFLTSRVKNLTVDDKNKFLDVLYYLNGTREYGIFLGASADGVIRLYAYADASFGIWHDAKGHGGTFISYGRGPILVRSNKLKEVDLSTSESELKQLSTTTSLAARELEFAKYQGYIEEGDSGILLEDNVSAIHMANNGKSISHRTRHIKIKDFFVKQYLDNGEFRLLHCPTKEMVADILTKPLQGADFYHLRSILLGYDSLSH